jgi:hypothetical protein
VLPASPTCSSPPAPPPPPPSLPLLPTATDPAIRRCSVTHMHVTTTTTTTYRRRSCPPPPTDLAIARCSERMHQLEESTRGIVKDTAHALKALSQMDGGAGGEARERRIQQDKLGRDFKSVLQKFQTASQVSIASHRITRAQTNAHARARARTSPRFWLLSIVRAGTACRPVLEPGDAVCSVAHRVSSPCTMTVY